MIMLML
ncbi:hypothetical protein LINPERPRIM_LOCUS28796 [Linum perenne]